MTPPVGSLGSATQIEFSQPSLLVHLKASKEQCLEKLHTEIQNSYLLPPELVPEIESFTKSTLDELGLFLLNIIEPAIVCYDRDNDALDKLLDFHDVLKNIIQDQLPKGTSIDHFLKQCEKLTDKAIQKDLTKFHIQEKTQKVYENANDINRLNLAQNKTINMQILQINANRESEVDKLKARLKPLEMKVQSIISHAQNSAPEIIYFCKKMEEQETACQQLLQACENAVNRVDT